MLPERKRKAIAASFKSIPSKMRKGVIHFFIHPFDGILLFLTFAFAAGSKIQPFL